MVDLGCGTGVLGQMACRAGAARVYALEGTSLIDVARQICAASGFGDRVTFLRQHSERAELPEKVDVVLADQLGPFGFEAGVLAFYADARKRFLKPTGVTIPSRIDLVACPVQSDEMWSHVEFWRTAPIGLDVSSVSPIAANNVYWTSHQPDDLLGEPAVVARLDPTDRTAATFRAEGVVEIARHGTLHGVAGWFSAQLSPTVTMTNSPLGGDARIDRENVFLPIDGPVAVMPGDKVAIELTVTPSDLMLAWLVTVLDSTGRPKASYRHSTFSGMLVSKEDMQRTRPGFAPTLTARGRARLTVLSLCDGRRPLADVEDTVWSDYPRLFGSRGQAAAFVAEVVTRNAE